MQLDEIKHHGQGDYDYQQTKLPLYTIKELEIIRDDMPQIKKAKTYNVDVYSSGCPIVEGLSFTVKKEGSQENSLL